MFERFRRSSGRSTTDSDRGAVALSEREAARDETRAHDRDDVAAREPAPGERRFARSAATGTASAPAATTTTPARERRGPVMGTDALATVRERQRERFGGMAWGSAFFGLLSAVGLAAILSAILVGAGVALGVSESDATSPGSAETIGLGGGIAVLVVLAIAWGCGGYVAGRMARFDGARQGIGVWLWTVLAVVAVAALALIGGEKYDVLQQLNLPSLAIGDSTLTTGGAITGAAALIVTLLAAIVGGKIGERFHKRVDRVATTEHPQT